MPIPDQLTQVAVGSSSFIWALDETTHAVFHKNTVTQDFEPVKTNIEVAYLDVSFDGHVIALDPDGKLYVWDPSTGMFNQHQGVNQTFDRVNLGNDTVWAQEGTTVYLWDNDQNSFVEAFAGAAALTVAKADDTVYLLDQDANLQRYNYTDGSWSIVTSELGVDSLAALSASSKGNLWGLTSNGEVYQWNSIDYADGDAPSSFVPKSEALELGSTTVSQFAVDDKSILYAVADDDLSFYDTESVSIQNLLKEQTYDVALTTDRQGTAHLVHSTDEAIFHSFYVNQQWVRDQAIPGSSQGSEITVRTDAAGNIYIAWLQGLGNAAEVYASKGVQSDGYAGYVFSEAVQITDDDVEDRDLDLEVSPGGAVTLTTAKIDADNPQDDLDVYHYGIDGDSALFSLSPEGASADSAAALLEVDPINHFLASAQGLDAWGFKIEWGVFTGGLGFKFKTPGGWFDLQMFGRLAPAFDTLTGEQQNKFGSEGRLGADLKKIVPGLESTSLLGDFKASFLAQSLSTYVPSRGSDNEHLEDTAVFAGFEVEAYADLAGLAADTFTSGFWSAIKVFGTDAQAGLFIDTRFLWNVFTSADARPAEAGAQGDNTIFLPPIDYVDSVTGGPVTDETPQQNIVAETTFSDYVTWFVNLLLAPVGASIGQDIPASPDATPVPPTVDGTGLPLTQLVAADASRSSTEPTAIQSVDAGTSSPTPNKLQVFFGLYASAKQKGPDLGLAAFDGTSVKGRAGVQINSNYGENSPYIELDKVGGRIVVDLTLGPVFWRPIDVFIGANVTDGTLDQYAKQVGFVDYVTGGTTAIYGDSDLVLGASTGGAASDQLDNAEFDYVLLSDGRAFGVFIEEVIDQSQASLDTVKTIEGLLDPVSGRIVWNEASVKELPGGRGLNFQPKIATHGDDELVIAWGNVPETDPGLVALNQTPPGKAYIVYGGEGQAGKTLDLSSLGNDVFDGKAGVYLSNDQNLYSIGASAGPLGDVNPGDSGGLPDFIFGAPDADGEAGKVYVIFGEKFYQVTDIDDLGGSRGFTVLGAFDSELGLAVSTAGDFNGDGVADLAMSAPGASNHSGAVYVIYGGNDWTLGDGAFTTADIGSLLDGTVLYGPADGSRWGTALAGGYDINGDGEDDLAVGSIVDGTVTLLSRTAERITIDVFADTGSAFDGNNIGVASIGAAVAMLPDINDDGTPDLLIGDKNGAAHVMFGGSRFDTYARNYVSSFNPDEGHQVLLSFNGEDRDGNGILSTATGEIDAWRMEVFENGVRVADYSQQDQQAVAAFEFSFEIENQRVLANAGAGQTDLDGQQYGLFVGIDRETAPTGDLWTLSSSAADTRLQLAFFADGSDTGTTEAATDGLGNNLFLPVSRPGAFDLDNLAYLPESGFHVDADTALPLQVAGAGDVNGDGVQDLIAGFDQATDQDGNVLSGRSYVLYGGDALTRQSGDLELDGITSAQGFVIDVAGGRVSGAGDVNGDGYDDLAVSAPHATDASGAEQAGNSFIIFGGADGGDANRYSLTNSIAREQSGAALAALGDVNGDGYGDVLVGAPQMIDPDNYTDAQLRTELVYSTRKLSEADWSDGKVLDDGAPGEVPAALADTSRGTLALWVDVTTGTDGQPAFSLRGSFYDGNGWSDPAGGSATGGVIRETDLAITDVAVTEAPSPRTGEMVPTVVWIETNLAQSQSTTVYQTSFDPIEEDWGSARPVTPLLAPTPAGAPDTAGEILVNEGERLSVSDVHASENDGVAAFTITRAGDLSEASDTYGFRLFDFSATHGSDYLGDPEGTFSFGAGEDSVTVPIAILPDDLDEGGTERLRLEVWSESDAAFVSRAGLAVPDADRITASLFIEDSSKILKLSSIDSGFQLNGAPDVSLGYALRTAGFLNGDKLDDFMIGAPTSGSDNQGSAYVLYGKAGISIADNNLDLDSLGPSDGVALRGSVAGGLAGSALAAKPNDVGGSEGFVAVGAPGTASDGSEGRVYVVKGSAMMGQDALSLDPANALVLSLGDGSAGDLFGSGVLLDDLDGDDRTDLVVAAPDAVYVIYDIFSQGETGAVTPDQFAKHTLITNGEGTGFGAGLATTDFDGDGYLDLVLGSSQGNRLLDAYDQDHGSGGFVAVLRGSKNGFGDSVDVSNLGKSGFRLLGEAAFAPTDARPTASPDDGGIEQPLRSGFELVDGVGDAITALDLSGDGADDLVIGAPRASLPDPDGLYTQNLTNSGRVYVLFGGTKEGGATDWGALTGDYRLTDLYGNDQGAPDRYRDGIILEGTVAGGLAGSSVSNLGAFRGATDVAAGVDDLAVGAPGVNATAGQAYAVFGSGINYSGLGKSENVFAIDPTADPARAGVLPVFGFQGAAEALSESNPSNAGAVGFSVAGLGDIDAESFGQTGGTDLGIGAPTSEDGGVAKTYIATGHPWIQPGDSLEVSDLRSDNGFITPLSGLVKPVGDFNQDGYDDFMVRDGDALTLILGSSIYDVEGSVNREITLDTLDGLYSYYTAGDYDGDGTPEIVVALQDGENAIVARYTPDALADPNTTSLAPQPTTAPPPFTDILNPEYFLGWLDPRALENGYSLSGDLNGDGYDDLVLGSNAVRPYTNDVLALTYAFGTPAPGVFAFSEAGAGLIGAFPHAVADIDGDGRDELITSNNSSNDPNDFTAQVWGWNETSGKLDSLHKFNWNILGDGRSVFAAHPGNVFLPGETGDVNGDGYEDFLISFKGRRDGTGTGQLGTKVVLGGPDITNLTATTLYAQDADFNTPINGNAGLIRQHFASILGDVNQDGYDDILVSQETADRDAFVVYGQRDMPEKIALPDPSAADNFAYGYAIEGLSGRDDIYEVGKAGDLNGDGVNDLLLSDASLDLTYGVYGERRTDAPGVTYIDGTSGDDVLIQQAASPGGVNVLAKEGDDFIQTLSGSRAFVFGGEGDDQIGLGQVDSSEIGRIDGGTGQDVLFFDPVQLGQFKSLDLTKIPGRITDIEIVDLGVKNAITFDVPTLKTLTGAANTLILKGVDSQAQPKISLAYNGWSKIGENAFDGDVYQVYEYTLPNGAETNFRVWIEKGGVAWSPQFGSAPEAEVLRGTGDGDFLNGGPGDDLLFGLAGDDTLFGGDGDDLVVGGPGGDLQDGGAGADLFKGTVAELKDDLIVIDAEDAIQIDGRSHRIGRAKELADGTERVANWRLASTDGTAFADLKQKVVDGDLWLYGPEHDATPSLTAPGQIVVYAAGTSYRGDPEFSLTVNGETIASGVAVASDPGPLKGNHLEAALQRFEFQIDPDIDIESVGVTFANDRYHGRPQLDRNLFVAKVEFDGEVFTPGHDAAFTPAGRLSEGKQLIAEKTGSLYWNGTLEFAGHQDGEAFADDGIEARYVAGAGDPMPPPAGRALASDSLVFHPALVAGGHDLAGIGGTIPYELHDLIG